MTERRFNYGKFGVFCIIVLAILIGIGFGIKSLINHYKYTKSSEFKLLNVGYSSNEVKLLTISLTEDKLKDIIKKGYNESIPKYVGADYFIYSKLDDYLDYEKEHENYDVDKIIAIINTESNIDWIDNQKEADVSLGELMLVNRVYGLNEEYEVEDIVKIPTTYAYAGVKLSQSVLDALTPLIDDAKEEGFTFVVSAGYRTYGEQKKIYDNYANIHGGIEADKLVARPGHSEYETGMSFDLEPYNKKYSDPMSSKEYAWLKENAYKYGFIFRFTEEKEYLTGFTADTWRLRYVGNEAARIIYDNDICFEEYYAYYIENAQE